VTAEDIIAKLELSPHPEGGFYRETWRDSPKDGQRGHGTAIYYLLRAGERSHWHRVDAVEIWHFHAGTPLELSLSDGTEAPQPAVLGMRLDHGERPQIIVPAGVWQSARSLGEGTLVSCTVSPAFVFEGFEMAPEGWEPGPVSPS